MIRQAIQKAMGKVKENYGYYKLGRQTEEKEIRRARVEKNIKNLKFWDEGAGGRMQKQYDDLKKKGVY